MIKWKHFLGYWPFVQGIQRSPVNSPHKGQWREALTFSLICAWINGWVTNREAGDLRRHYAHCNIIVMNHWWMINQQHRKLKSKHYSECPTSCVTNECGPNKPEYDIQSCTKATFVKHTNNISLNMTKEAVCLENIIISPDWFQQCCIASSQMVSILD